MVKLNRKVDFTQGSILKSLIAFSIPILLGELLQNLYNSVDAIVVGNFVGEKALAAVTVGSYVSNLIIGFFNGMSVGSNVVVARAFGRGIKSDIQKSIKVSFTFSLILGVLLSIVGIIFTPFLLKIAGVKTDYYVEALGYLRIYLAGIMFTVIYNCGAGIMRAYGESTKPFYFLLITCIINIFMDLFCVKSLNLGVNGAAWATVFSQWISVLLVYIQINKDQDIRCIDFKEMFNNGGTIISQVANIGVSAGLQSAIIAISNMFVIRYVNIFDTYYVAGVGIGQKLDRFVAMPLKSFGITMSTYVGQNYGAGKYNRIKDGFIKCIILSCFTIVAISTSILFFKEGLVRLFSKDEKVIEVGAAMLGVFLPYFSFGAIREVFSGLYRGYGHSLEPTIFTLSGMVVFRQIYLAITMNNNPRIENIFYSFPLSWIVSAILMISYFPIIQKKLRGLGKNE